MLSSKSSKWLHRLRASRGFPDSDNIDLDHFLSSSSSSSPDQIHPTDSAKTPLPEDDHKCHDNERLQVPDSITNLLSELFHMGQFHHKPNKKTSRKQNCPKICLLSTNLNVVPNDSVSAPSALPFTGSISRRKVKEVNHVVVEEEEEKGLTGYSQTEVTVIDTSVSCWKFEKVLYRSKNVWKVGDKKGKGLINSDRNKRLNENCGDVHKKKLKKKLKLCNSSKKEELLVLSKVNQGHDQGKMVAANEKKRDNCSQVREKSFCKKQTEEGSSVIIIKSIPTTNKKSLSSVTNNCVKSVHR